MKTIAIAVGTSFLIFSCALGFILLTKSGVLKLERDSGTVRISDTYLTTDPDDPNAEIFRATDGLITFSREEPIIHLITTIDSDNPVAVGVRWYRENDLIFQQIHRVNGTVAWFIEPRELPHFQSGLYRVVVYLGNDPVRTMTFEIR